MVVLMQPLLRQRPDFPQAVEHVAVEHCREVSPIESLNVGVLGWLAPLDELQGDATFSRQCDEFTADELRPVVHPQALRLTPQFDQFGEGPDHTFSGRLVSISTLSASRLKSSRTLKVIKRRPFHSASAMKSIDQV